MSLPGDAMKDWSTEAWNRIDTLLGEALDRPPEERDDFLDRAAATPEVRQHVEALLAAERRAPAFLDADAASVLTSASPDEWLSPDEPLGEPPSASSQRGQRVGAYRLDEEIGRGGTSRVFRAHRADGAFEQEVAVKILRVGLDSDAARRRFRLERQVLAELQHPNIAQCLDGGLTDDDVPYVVMEYVDGMPITAYCEAHACSVADRVGLLQTVGEALQHAHGNLIVHRDLKPSNILITDDGRVKLLDFGIAKLLDAEAAATGTPSTRTGVRPMTPAYAAPEQVNDASISVATDVYQLGAVAYELLTGTRPKPSTEAASDSTAPERPSKVAERHASAQDGARADALRGDLDAILLKALRSAPEDRYASAEAFASDLGRYLRGQPVQARPPTLRYRAQKFVRRHRTGVLTAAAIAALVVGFAVLLVRQHAQTVQQRNRAQRSAQAAEDVASFLVDLFAASAPVASQGDPVTARQLLRRGQQRIDQLDRQPRVKARLLDAMGRARQGLGHHDTAQQLLTQSLALRQAAASSPDRAVATGLDHLADAYAQGRDYERADSLYRAALAQRRRTLGPRHPQTAETLEGLAHTLRDLGKPDSAVLLARRALSIHRSRRDSTHPEVLDATHTLAYSLRATGRHGEAASLYQQVLAGERAQYGPGDLRLAATHNDLAYLRKQQGRYAAAVRHYRRALRIRQSALPPAHPETMLVLQNLAGALWEQDKDSEVEAVLRQRVRALREHAPSDTARLGSALGGLARFLGERGRLAEAVPPLQAAHRMYRSHYGSDNLYTLCKSGELGAALRATGQRPRRAASLLRRHHARLQARRDTILKHRDVDTQMDVRASLRAVISMLERAASPRLVRQYERLLQRYTPADG